MEEARTRGIVGRRRERGAGGAIGCVGTAWLLAAKPWHPAAVLWCHASDADLGGASDVWELGFVDGVSRAVPRCGGVMAPLRECGE